MTKTDQSLTLCLLLWSASTFIVRVLSSSPPVSRRFTSVPQRCHIYTFKREWNRPSADSHPRSDLIVLEAVVGSSQQACLPHSNHGRTHRFTLPASSASTHVGWDRPPPKNTRPVVNGGAPPCGHHYCWCSDASKEPKMPEYTFTGINFPQPGCLLADSTRTTMGMSSATDW